MNWLLSSSEVVAVHRVCVALTRLQDEWIQRICRHQDTRTLRRYRRSDINVQASLRNHREGTLPVFEFSHFSLISFFIFSFLFSYFFCFFLFFRFRPFSMIFFYFLSRLAYFNCAKTRGYVAYLRWSWTCKIWSFCCCKKSSEIKIFVGDSWPLCLLREVGAYICIHSQTWTRDVHLFEVDRRPTTR